VLLSAIVLALVCWAHTPVVAAPTSGLVSPVGSTFAVAFPSDPREAVARASGLEQFPGARTATAYYVSPDSGNIMAASAPVPHTPTYLVMTCTFRSQPAAEKYASAVGRLPGMKPVLVGAVAGYRFVGRERSPINRHNHLTQPNAFESYLVVKFAKTVYSAIAITTSRSASLAFVRSLVITDTPTASSPNGAVSAGGGQPAHLATVGKQKSSAYRLGTDTGYALVALLAIAIIVKYARPRRPRTARRAATQYAGSPPTDPSSPNPQFAWMYPALPPEPAPQETPNQG